MLLVKRRKQNTEVQIPCRQLLAKPRKQKTAEVQILRESVTSLESEKSSTKQELDTQVQVNQEIQLKNASEKIETLKNEVKTLKKSAALYKGKRETLEKQVSSLTTEKSVVEQQNLVLKRDLEAALRKPKLLEAEKQKLFKGNKTLVELNSALSMRNKDLVRLNQNLFGKIKMLETSKNTRKYYISGSDDASWNEINELLEKIESLEIEIEQLLGKVKRLESENQTLYENIMRLEEENQEHETDELLEAKQRSTELESKNKRLRSAISKLQSEADGICDEVPQK